MGNNPSHHKYRVGCFPQTSKFAAYQSVDANSKCVLLQAYLNHDLLLHKVANTQSDKSCLTKLNPSHTVRSIHELARAFVSLLFRRKLLMST